MITFKTTWETLCEHHGLVQIWKISYPFGGRSWLDIFSDQIFRGVEPLQVLHISIAMFQGLTWLGICWLSFILSFICFGFFLWLPWEKEKKKKNPSPREDNIASSASSAYSLLEGHTTSVHVRVRASLHASLCILAAANHWLSSQPAPVWNLQVIPLGSLVYLAVFQAQSFMRKIKDLCCELNFLCCSFSYDLSSMDFHYSFLFREHIHQVSTSHYLMKLVGS